MNKYVCGSMLVAFLIGPRNVGAAEVTNVSFSDLDAPCHDCPRVEKYAQVCIGNLTDKSILVATSWVGEEPYRAWIAPNHQHMYRFTATTEPDADDGDQPFNVVFSMRRSNTCDVADLTLAFSRVKTDRCGDMPLYNFVTVTEDGVSKVALLPDSLNVE